MREDNPALTAASKRTGREANRSAEDGGCCCVRARWNFDPRLEAVRQKKRSTEFASPLPRESPSSLPPGAGIGGRPANDKLSAVPLPLGAPMDTRTIAIAALVIAVILVLVIFVI